MGKNKPNRKKIRRYLKSDHKIIDIMYEYEKIKHVNLLKIEKIFKTNLFYYFVEPVEAVKYLT